MENRAFTPVKHAFGIDWFTGTGCKQYVIDTARQAGHEVVLGWTHPALSHRCYGSCRDLSSLLGNLPPTERTADNSHGFPDLEGLYHTTLDDQRFPPYFDMEWTTATEEAYPWVCFDTIIGDIVAGMWHMFGVSLTSDDFCIATASGESGGTFKHSYHVLVRPASGPGIAMTKAQLKEFWEVCLQPKYTVQHPSEEGRSQNIIDPAVYGHQFDFRMIYQSKPGGKRPLKPVTQHESICDHLLDYLPEAIITPSCQLPATNTPPLPAQLLPLAPPKHKSSPKIAGKDGQTPAHAHTAPAQKPAHNERAGSLAQQFSWLTPRGKLHLVRQVLDKAGITDIRPNNLEPDGSVYCITNKSTGRACMCSTGERHVSNNVICRLSRDGGLYYKCLAPKAECKQPVAVGSWLEFVADPAALFKASPPLVDVNAVRESLHAMCDCRYTSKQPASYQALKAVFEVANFKVTTPLQFVRLTTASEQDAVTDELYYCSTKKELMDTYTAVTVQAAKETKRGVVETSEPFINAWLKDPRHRTYTKLDFLPPPLKCGHDTYNTFTGFDAEHWDVEDSGDISMWTALLQLASNFDPKAARILEMYFAQMIQAPGLNSEAGWATSSFAKGAGKDCILLFIKLIMGGRYYFETASPLQELLGEHSLGLAHKLLVHINESEDLRKSVGKVRHLITTKQVEINPKFLRQYKVRNLARWVVSGNEEGLVEHCRRWFQTSFSSKRVGDHQFWKELHSWRADKRNLKAVFNHLKSMDLSGVTSMQALFSQHTTEATRHAAMRNADNITHFLVQLVQERIADMGEQREAGLITGYNGFIEQVYTCDLYQFYQDWGVDKKLWRKDDLPTPDMIEFARKISYRFARTGRDDPGIKHKQHMGKSRRGGFEINWRQLYTDLVAMHFIIPEEETTLQTQLQEQGDQQLVEVQNACSDDDCF